MSRKKEQSPAELAKKYFRARELGKRWYKRADAALEGVSLAVRPGTEIAISETKKAVLVDLFENKFTVYKPLGFRRFDLELKEA